MKYRRAGTGEFAVTDEIFAKVWRTTLPELKRRALRLSSGHAARAEDLLSDTAIKSLVFMRGSPDVLTDVEGLLFVVLRHVFLDGMRRRKRESAVLDRALDERAEIEFAADAGLSALQRMELQEQMDRVVAAVAVMTRDQRRLFAFRFVEELPYPVIAERLHINQPLARKRVELLRKRLKDALPGD